MADTVSQTVLFPDLFDKPLVATFERLRDPRDGEQHASSDGGAVLLKAAERQYGLRAIDRVRRVSRSTTGSPARSGIRCADLLGQRIFGIACGHHRWQRWGPPR